MSKNNNDQKSKVESTFKSMDTEETLDIYFYRPIGYRFALISKALNMTPNTITVISIIIGVFAGHLFYYQDLTINVIGMLMLIFANSLDSTDGQLARMTGQTTKLGRFLDGFAGNVWYVSIYLHLWVRMMDSGYSPWILLLILLTGLSHSFQAAMSDYYRNAHLFFIKKNSLDDIETSDEMKKDYDAISWKNNFFKKLYMRLFLNYNMEQEILSSNFQKLISFIAQKWGNDVPDDIRAKFREGSRPLQKYCNIMTVNTRMIALFVSLFIGDPIWFILFEISILNIMLFYTVRKHERVSAALYDEIKVHPAS